MIRRLLLVALAVCSSCAFAQQDDLERRVEHGRQRFDLWRVSGDNAQDAPAQAPAPAYDAVDKTTLKAANDEILALRQKVWDGQLPPEKFYPEIQAAFARRFGPDYGAKVKAFLDADAAAAPRPAQTIDFARMTPEQRDAFFKRMPKGAELHLHLTGAIPGDKILEIGERLGTKLPVANVLAVLRIPDLSAYGVDASKKELTVAEFPAKLRSDLAAALATRDGENFTQFLDKWKIIGPIASDTASYYPMMKYLAEYAKAQNIVYLELLVGGYGYTSPQDPVIHTEIQQAAAAAAKRVEKETGVAIRLIVSNGWYANRKQDDAAIAMAQSLADQGVVGFNMVADERLPSLNHYEAFKPLRDRLSRLSVSLHAGEQAGTAPNIVNDLLLNPKRYGHATHVDEDPIAMAVLYENKIPVEVSLVSNQKTLVMTDLSKHPEPRLLAWGVPIVPDTDDPGVFGSTLSQEYQLSQSQFNLSWDQLKEMSRNGIRHSFADEATKTRLMKDLDARIAAFEASKDFQTFKLSPRPASPPRPVELELDK